MKSRNSPPPFRPRDYYREILSLILILLVACIGHLIHYLRKAPLEMPKKIHTEKSQPTRNSTP